MTITELLTISCTFHVTTYFILTATPESRYYYYPHFIDY